MNWKELLSTKRCGQDHSAGKRDLRSEFGKDYHRIIESASFRRLQDKTQVFPLDRSDFIRTRLTHSLEVSSIGRSLAQNIASSIINRQLDPAFGEAERDSLCEVLECAGLIHDIGNPPFGHFGEESIREWFRKNLDYLTYRGRPVCSYLSKEQRADLLNFEGNAQGFRLVTRLHYPVDENGMNLTAANLAAMLKYPNSSLEIKPGSLDVSCRKMGYLTSEKDRYEWVIKETGTRGLRSPVTLILEAADDIAYAAADIEDAFKKGFFNYEILTRELSERGIRKSYIRRLTDLYDLSRLASSVNPEETAIRRWLAEMQDELIYATTEEFLLNYQAIMAGGFKTGLIHGGGAEKLLAALKGIAYDYAFTSSSIYRTEIAANTILNFLLDQLVSAALQFDARDKPGLMEEKYLSLISENYKQVYLEDTRNLRDEEKVYNRILLATDSVAGMTDSHASGLYEELKAGFTTLF